MLLKRIISLTVIFSLLISVIGISYTKAYCNPKKMAEQGCCKKGTNKSCCEFEKIYKKLDSDISSVHAAINLPSILLFLVSLPTAFQSPVAVLKKQHSYTSYTILILVTDISVLNRVFRI